MEYRLSLTPRLLTVGLCATVALLVLLFALGFQVGQSLAGTGPVRTPPPVHPAPTATGTADASPGTAGERGPGEAR